MGIFGETPWRRKWQRVYDLGLTNIDLCFFVSELYLPFMNICLEYILTPFFITRTICLFYIPNNYSLQTIITRFSFVGYLLVVQLKNLIEIGCKSLIKLHNQIFDSRYLVGTELANR